MFTIQDSLRKAGFPDFQKHFIAVLNLTLEISQFPTSQSQQLTCRRRSTYFEINRAIPGLS